MYRLVLRSGGSITCGQLMGALGAVDAECGTVTHNTRMRHLAELERLGARGMRYANQDFDIMSSALNFLDAVLPEHGLRESTVPA
jgi:hypothetical protein